MYFLFRFFIFFFFLLTTYLNTCVFVCVRLSVLYSHVIYIFKIHIIYCIQIGGYARAVAYNNIRYIIYIHITHTYPRLNPESTVFKCFRISIIGSHRTCIGSSGMSRFGFPTGIHYITIIQYIIICISAWRSRRKKNDKTQTTSRLFSKPFIVYTSPPAAYPCAPYT